MRLTKKNAAAAAGLEKRTAENKPSLFCQEVVTLRQGFIGGGLIKIGEAIVALRAPLFSVGS